MIATCTSNRAAILPEAWYDHAVNLSPSTTFPLTVGRDYVVYAVALRNDQIWLFVDDDNGLYYPMSYPALLFEILDDRVSSLWHFKLTPKHLDHTALFAIREWVADEFYYDRLTDGNPNEVRTFASAKEAMIAEAKRL